MDSRKEELEKKRQKLAELRKAREERQSAFREKESTKSKEKGVEELVTLLVGDVQPAPALSTPTGSISRPATPQLAVAELSASTQPVQTIGSESIAQPTVQVQQIERPTPTLSYTDIVLLDFAPKERVFYSKEIQTVESSLQEPDENESEPLQKEPKATPEQQPSIPQQSTLQDRKDEVVQTESEPLPPQVEYTEDEKKEIIDSEPFLDFFNQTSKIVERALFQPYDPATDYSLDGAEDKIEASGAVKSVLTFFSEKTTHNRSITDVSWSNKHSELILASYNKNPNAINESDGLVHVWNLHLPSRPEYTFYAQSVVLRASFSKFHPNLIVGSTYSGQIVLWDTRAKSHPVQRTPMTEKGHAHPVYSMAIVGVQSAHNLITASTDGMVCAWQLDMLTNPQETMELINPAVNRHDEVAITALGFPEGETSQFWVGTEEGYVFQAGRNRPGSKSGMNPSGIYERHDGPITSLQFHPQGPIDFSNLFITSSMDWTVKLWQAKSPSKSGTEGTSSIKPLRTFDEADDYVYDVKWSPTHPSVFATASGDGYFDIWNLNVETEMPLASTTVGAGKAINRLEFEKDGKKVGLGASDGRLHVYDIGELAAPRPDEWQLFQRTINEMESASLGDVTR